MSQVICESPRIILNPKLPELLAKYRLYFYKGDQFYYSKRHVDDFPFYSFGVKKNHISHDDLENCYVVDDKSGEVFPIYLEVPCGNCAICKVSKINSFVQRCRYEAQMYDSLPWFVTLTYSPEFVHPPKFQNIVFKDKYLNDITKKVPVGGVNVRDCQLFLKRLRRNIDRSPYLNFKFRYVGVAEYGHHPVTGTFNRPHYHFIFFGIDTFSPIEHAMFVKCLKDAWNMGHITHRLMSLADDDKGTYYTCKYLKKDCEVPDGCVPTFMISSRRNGGIGAGFIDKCSGDIKKYLNVNFKYRDKWTGKIVPFQFSRYVLNRIFPSFCKIVSSKFRHAVSHIVTAARMFQGNEKFMLMSKGLCNFCCFDGYDYEQMSNDYSPFFYTGINSWLPSLESKFKHFGASFNNYLDALCNFDLYFVSIEDCKKAVSAQLLRDKFISKLFRFAKPVDLVSRKTECQTILEYKSSYCVL